MLPFSDKRVIRPPDRYIVPMDVPTRWDRQIDPPQGDASAGGGGNSFVPPFCLEQVDDTNVKVKFGQVNGITPTGIATNIDVSGTDGTWSIYLDCTINDDGSLSAATISSGTSGVPADTSNHAYVLIGEADVASSIITAVRYSLLFSQGFVACGRDPADPSTTPGSYFFFVGSGPGDGGSPPPPSPP